MPTTQQTSNDPVEARNWAHTLTDEALVHRLFIVSESTQRGYNATHKRALIREAAVRLRRAGA